MIPPRGVILGHFQRLFDRGTLSGMGEGPLLERFLATRDDLAFEALVMRHGPMVLGVCRRVLADPHDVEDAFQATFLVLVRRAASIRDRDLLGPWLHGVAHRVAIRARVQSATRRLRERPGSEEIATESAPAPDADDLRAIIDAEIARLPERFRAPIILCYLEGKTHEEAARLLRCPVGTVRSRLARGRERLRVRFLRRGLDPSAGLLASPVLKEAVSASLAERTAQAALAFAAGKLAGAGAVSASVISLAKGVLRTMLMTKLKIAALMLMASGTVATGTAVLARHEPGSQLETTRSREVPPPSAEIDRPAPQSAKEEAVVDPKGFQALEQSTQAQAEIEILEMELATEKDQLAKRFEELRRDEARGYTLGAMNKEEAIKMLTSIRQKYDEDRRKYIENTVQLAREQSRLAATIRPGQHLMIEVLEALPGRPISGTSLVRPDGTVSLGYYGDVYVAGLTLKAAKSRIIQHLRRFINDEVLGLVEYRDGDHEQTPVPPEDSDRVYVLVDEGGDYHVLGLPLGVRARGSLESTVDQILHEVRGGTRKRANKPRAKPGETELPPAPNIKPGETELPPLEKAP